MSIAHVDSFFNYGKAAIHRYQAVREGKLTVDCQKRSNDGSKKGFKVIAHGFPDNPFCFTPADLNTYRSRQQLQMARNGIDEPFCYFEENVLEVLDRTGYGQVSLNFERDGKGNTAIICLVTFSHRYIIKSES